MCASPARRQRGEDGEVAEGLEVEALARCGGAGARQVDEGKQPEGREPERRAGSKVRPRRRGRAGARRGIR